MKIEITSKQFNLIQNEIIRLEEEYFNKQNKRYEEFVSQARLW